MECPVCRAETAERICRCRTDLTMLWNLEAQRGAALAAAADAWRSADADAVRGWAGEANRLREGPDALRWEALGALVQGDFAAAFRAWHHLAPPVTDADDAPVGGVPEGSDATPCDS